MTFSLQPIKENLLIPDGGFPRTPPKLEGLGRVKFGHKTFDQDVAGNMGGFNLEWDPPGARSTPIYS